MSINMRRTAYTFGAAALLASASYATPGYLKIGDIKGESRAVADGSLEHTDDWIAARGMAWTTVGQASSCGVLRLDTDDDGDGVDIRSRDADLCPRPIYMELGYTLAEVGDADGEGNPTCRIWDSRANRWTDGMDNDCDGVMEVVSPRDAASGMATGKRQRSVSSDIHSGRSTGVRQRGRMSSSRPMDSASPASDMGGAGGGGRIFVRGHIDKSSPMLAKELDKATPLLMVHGRFDRCEPGMDLGDVHVSSEGGAYTLSGASIAACDTVRTEVLNNKSSRSEDPALPYQTIVVRYAGRAEYQDGNDLVLRKRPGR